MLYVQSVKKTKKTNKRNSPITSNASYPREIKLIPNNMGYYQFQFHAVNFFLGVRFHGGSVPNFNFFNVNPRI